MIDEILQKQIKFTIDKTNFPNLGSRYQGKVRDNYSKEGIRVIIATDRLSAFDRVITTIPFKGQILNQISSFWFEKTQNIARNHLISVPDPNVSVVHECETVPIEMVIRGYITGSLWRSYQKDRIFSGIEFPAGLIKNQRLDEPIITPSTKAEHGHDIYISKKEILEKNMVPKSVYDQMEEATIKLFEFGQKFSKENHLILVDTKYEFGIKEGELMVIDEIHTPDSSRFWIANTYEELFSESKEPDILDKEFFRGWLMDSFPDIFPDIRPDQDIPPIPDDVKVKLAKRYVNNFEKITGSQFKPEGGEDLIERIQSNLKGAGYL
jgi:phosphoribosylaminoimidazole-succinocarboxamide synthase